MNTEISPELLRRFAALFAGRKDAWGAIGGYCEKEALTLSHYRRHIEGKISLGVYPLRQDGRCRWFAIDIDLDDIDAAIAIVEHLSAFGFNRGVYLERTKSKGYHAWGFFSNWVPARDVRRIASAAISNAGLPPTVEVFPKQDSADSVRFGNYLNLPYFGGDNIWGRRMILDSKTLLPIPFLEWLRSVQAFPANALPLILENLPPEASKHPLTETAKIPLHNLPVGARRPTLVRLAGYLRSRGVAEDIAVGLLLPWAEKAFNAPLSSEEVERHVRGIYRRYGAGRPKARQDNKTWYAEAPL